MFVKKAARVFVTILLLGSLAGCKQELEDVKTEKIVNEYIQFQKDMGEKEGEDCLKMIPDIFTKDVVKITDGRKFAQGHEGLEKHCLELRSLYDTWYVNVKSHVVSEDKKSATIIYEITTKKAGIFEVVVVLKLTEDHKIKEVSESYYRLEAYMQD